MKRKLFLVTVALLFINAITFAQQTTVKGKIVAEDGSPLPGASVIVKGTTTGTVADIDGNYTLSFTSAAGAILQFSYIGYITEEVAFANQSAIDMTLIPDISDLDEVVVVGYGVQKKSLVTGAISKIAAEDLVATQPQRVEQAIQGKVSGVTVTSESGSPGAGLTIKIRGTSSNRKTDPLFIVDGMKTGGIDYLDPADIESIEILKDAASAAIYGAEGGNGVVLVTTKKGKAGMAEVTYSGYYGVQTYMNNFDLMSGDQYVKYYQDAYLYEAMGKFPTQTLEQQTAKANSQLTSKGLPIIGQKWNGPQTNWLDEMTSPAPMMSHNIGINGGNEKTSYSSSFNYFEQKGITGGDKSQFKRLTTRLNMEHKANDYLTVGIKATYSHKERSSLSENSEFGGVYTNAVLFDPLLPVSYDHDSLIPKNYVDTANPKPYVRDDNGKAYGLSNRTINEIINPAAQVKVANGGYKEDKVLAGAFAEIEPIKGLKYKISYDVDVANGFNEWYTPKTFYNSVNERTYSDANQQRNLWYTWQFDNVLSYNKSFGEHSLSAIVGTHAEEYNHDELTATGWDLIKEEYAYSHPAHAQNLPSINASDSSIIEHTASSAVGGDRETARKLASTFARLSYNYGEKYLFNVTVRNDRSSMLSPKENPETGRPFNSGIFPSFSAGWVISKESFWNVPVVNFLKLRYSYGVNGSLGPISPFGYVSVIESNGAFVYMDDQGVKLDGATPGSLANDALSWEQTKMHNFGLDYRFLESKFSGSVEYFIKNTEGLLEKDVIGGVPGNNPPYANMGTVKNNGLELELTYNETEGDFQWDLGGNVSFLKNEMITYPTEANGAGVGIGGAVTRITEGQPIYYFYGYKTDGLWKDAADLAANNWYTDSKGVQREKQVGAIPGDIKIVNTDTSAVIDAKDKTYIGQPHPKVLLGVNFNANYKGFDLSVSLSGALGQEVYYGLYRYDVGITNHPVYWQEDAWSPENTDAKFYRPTASSKWNGFHNDMYVQNGSYVKVKNLTLGYTLPTAISKKAQISRARVYVSANNLLTMTQYKGIDPEMGNTGGIASYGIDRGFYPQARQFLFGVNVTF